MRMGSIHIGARVQVRGTAVVLGRLLHGTLLATVVGCELMPEWCAVHLDVEVPGDREPRPLRLVAAVPGHDHDAAEFAELEEIR
jgi:hypothetical protein